MSQAITPHSTDPDAEMDGARTQEPRRRPWLDVLLILLLAPICLAAGLILGYTYLYKDQVFPGVHVMGVSLGGLTTEQARSLLSKPIAEQEGRLITLRSGDRVWTASAAELGLRYDLDSTIDRAYAIGRDGDYVENARTRASLLLQGVNAGAVLETNRVRMLDYLQRLARQIDTPMQNATLTVQNLQVVATPSRVGQRLDVEATAARVADALARGDSRDVDLAITNQMPMVADSSIAEARATLERILSGPVVLKFTDSGWADSNGAVTQYSKEKTWTIDKQQLADAVQMEQRKNGDQVTLNAALDSGKFAALLKTIAKDVKQSPQNARFTRDAASGKLTPTRISQEGRALDTEESARRVLQAALGSNRTVALAVTVEKPAVSLDQMDKMGIKELVSRGETFYSGSSSNRTYNIKLAADKLNGVVIPPGGRFSFLDELGPITEAAGFKEGYAIVGDYTVKDVGGGVCQVATTFFRAIFWSGFPVLERNQHRYRLSYYELKGEPVGFDAAVYDPGRDLRFQNTSQNYILVQSVFNPGSNSLAFEFYGTKPGWEVSRETPATKPGKAHGPALPDAPDPALPAGQRILVQPAVDGLDATIIRVIKQGGQEVRRDTFRSLYEPASLQYAVGTKS